MTGGIEQYLILQGEKDGSCYTVKVVPIILSNVGIDEQTAWDKALENLRIRFFLYYTNFCRQWLAGATSVSYSLTTLQ